VPVVNLMNHDPRPNAIWSMDRGGLSVSIEATRRIQPGEEITILYDDVPNAKLLLNYGFVCKGDGPHRCLDFAVEMQGTSADLRILPSGALARRSALAPLLAAAGTVPNAQEEVARTVADIAAAERRAWLEFEASPDAGVAALAQMSVEVLGHLLERLEGWISCPKGRPLLAVLGGLAAFVDSGSEGSSSSSSASEAEET